MIWALVIGAWHIPPVRLERVQRRRCAPSPADWPERPWYELALDFARGRYGVIVDSDHYVAYFEDKRRPTSSAKSATRRRR